MEVTIMGKTKIVVLGAGYGGLMTVKYLQKYIGRGAEIVLVNKNDYHYETTWLHEASAGTLHHNEVRYDILGVTGQKVEFVHDTVLEINKDKKEVVLEKGALSYDYLVVALGGESETFGIPGLKEYAFGITNVNTARRLRKHIELQFANFHLENRNQDEPLTIVVGGAGFTGIEFLGELTNRIPKLCREYDIEPSKVKVICVEAAPTALPGFDPELVDYAVSRLTERGVEFLIGTAIKECTPEGILVAKGVEDPYEIKASTVVWAAGVRGSSIIEKSGFENMRGRVKVNADLRVPGYDDIFVIGDSSLIIDETSNRPYPPTAQIAMQQGKSCAKNLSLLFLNKQELETFKFDNKGTVCSLGENDAIGVVYGKKLTGFKASVMKKIIDNRALFLIGGLDLVLKKGKFRL
jgi:NADH dehydrogenase